MLARASSDAGYRIRRSKSTSIVHRQPPLTKPKDEDLAQLQALAAATTAFNRAQGVEAAVDRQGKRSSDLARTKSNASRKSLISQGSHFPPRESSFRSMPPSKKEQTTSAQRPSRASTLGTEQFPPFYATPNTDTAYPEIRPLSAQPSIYFAEGFRPASQPRPHRQSASSSVTSQQIRKARSMYYASSVQTGSPIARPPAKYLTPAPRIRGHVPALEPISVHEPSRTLEPSPLAASRIPATVSGDETLDTARDKYLQSFQQHKVRHKPSMFLAPFVKRQEKSKDRSTRNFPSAVSAPTNVQQTPDDSTAEITLADFVPHTEPKESSFSGSLKSKFKKVFRRVSNNSPRLPVQQISASREYFHHVSLDPPATGELLAIPSPDEDVLQRVRSRTPSLDCVRPTFNRSGSRTSSNGSSRSNRSLHSESNITHTNGSRVASWGTNSTSDTMTQRAIKRLTVIHEAKDSIGSEADRIASMASRSNTSLLPALASFRDPMPMESLIEESSTPIDPKRVFSALMREIDASKPRKRPLNGLNQGYDTESDVFESGKTKDMYTSVRKLHTSAGHSLQARASEEHRPPSRRPDSAAAQSTHSKSSTIRTFGRAIRSTIRTVTPAEHLSLPCADTSNCAIKTPRTSAVRSSSIGELGSKGDKDEISSSDALQGRPSGWVCCTIKNDNH